MMSRLAAMAGLVTVAFLIAWPSATVDAGEPGMIAVAMGGGSLDDALFNSTTTPTGDATFSVFIGYDKHGEFKGTFHFKRLYRGEGVRAIISTEITDFEEGFDTCPWARMAGTATLHATWVPKPIRGEKFEVEVWDCDGLEVPDMIWWQVRRGTNDSERPALTLYEATELTGGNIMVR
jgi:hypothetical protein